VATRPPPGATSVAEAHDVEPARRRDRPISSEVVHLRRSRRQVGLVLLSTPGSRRRRRLAGAILLHLRPQQGGSAATRRPWWRAAGRRARQRYWRGVMGPPSRLDY
jgi:hypothetical protein